MNGAVSIGAALSGGAQALSWALQFYIDHLWPLVAIAAVPAAVRGLLGMRGRQMLPAGAAEATAGLVVLWRGVLMLSIAGLDLLPDSPWWESIWPGAWSAALGARIDAMGGRGLEWALLCCTIALVVTVLAGLLRLLTTPRHLRRVMLWTGVRRHRAARRAEAIGMAVGNLITIPLTTLLIYAAVARAALLLRA